MYKKVDYSRFWRPTLVLKKDITGFYYAIYERKELVATRNNLFDAISLSVKIERDLYKKFARIDR